MHFCEFFVIRWELPVGKTMPCLPSPSHHHFYTWYKLTIPRKMGCKNGIVLPTIGFSLRFFCQSYTSMMTHLVGGGWLHDKHVGCWPHAGSGIGGFEYLWLQKNVMISISWDDVFPEPKNKTIYS